MAKLNKEKFEIGGYHKNYRTTGSGDMELYLHYDVHHHTFYFEGDEIRKHLGEKVNVADFSKCFTREDAIKVMKWMIDSNSVNTKMIRIEIRMPSELYKVPNPSFNKGSYEKYIINPAFQKHLAEMLDGSSIDGSGLSIKFQRVMKIESNGVAGVADCDENWDYDKRYVHRWSKEGNLIEYTPEREAFLINVQNQMNLMCEKVLDFFNAESLDKLYTKMESNVKLLGK
jgi:hypothetical protein